MRKWVWALGALAGCTVETAAAPPVVGSLTDRIAALEAKASAAGVSSVPSGTVVAYAGHVPPDGWLFCDGSELDSSDGRYKALFDAVGNVFGGEGAKFKLPDLQGRVVLGAGSYLDPVLQMTKRSVGELLGAAAHKLTVDEMPVHNHVQDPHTHSDSGHQHLMLAQDSNSSMVGDCVSIYNPTFGNPTCSDTAHPNLMDTSYAQISTDTATNQPAGGDKPHDILPPSAVLNYMIKL
jgi:microcystin-dependent protein